MNLTDFIVKTFVIVDDFCKKHAQARKLRSRGFLPKLADSEVITMEIVGEYLGYHRDKDIYQYFKRHWQSFFPQMPDRSNFVRQAANLWKVKEMLFVYLNNHQSHWLEILDSMPMEVCKFVRAKRTNLFKGSAAYGKWFGRTYFGYRLHLKMTTLGMIKRAILAPASIHDIHFVQDLLEGDHHCWVLADKGYRSQPLQKRLWQGSRIYFHTPFRRNEKISSPLPKATTKALNGKRRLIETVNGQLTEQFSIKSTWARDLWHLLNRIIRKIVAHTLCVFLNLKLHRDPLKLKSLVS